MNLVLSLDISSDQGCHQIRMFLQTRDPGLAVEMVTGCMSVIMELLRRF